MASRHTVQPGAAVSLRLRDLLATNCSKLYKVKSMNRRTFQAEFKGF